MGQSRWEQSSACWTLHRGTPPTRHDMLLLEQGWPQNMVGLGSRSRLGLPVQARQALLLKRFSWQKLLQGERRKSVFTESRELHRFVEKKRRREECTQLSVPPDKAICLTKAFRKKQ